MKIQTTCGRGDAHMEGIEGLPLTTRIRFQCEDLHLKSCHNVWSNGIYHDRSSRGHRGGAKALSRLLACRSPGGRRAHPAPLPDTRSRQGVDRFGSLKEV